MGDGKETVDIDLKAIRAIDGRQDLGFEEFCCQLARREEGVPPGSRFVRYRGAGGDGGVECVWMLPGGEEWGWQAKYIFRLSKRQLDKSVTTALSMHPQLKRYTICLPFDLTGLTGRGGKSESHKMAEYVNQWEHLARSRGMEVQFAVCSKSELLDRLIHADPHQGRLLFWFDLQVLGEDWFRNQVADAARAAEPRYTPQLSVKTALWDTFEAFGRTPLWEGKVRELAGKVSKAVRDWSRTRTDGVLGPEEVAFPTEAEECAAALDERLASVRDVLDALAAGNAPTQASDELDGLVGEASELAHQCLSMVRHQLDEIHGEGKWDSAGWRQFMAEYQVSFPTRHVDATREVIELLGELATWLGKGYLKLAKSHAMLLYGLAGIGKTHSICDQALDRHDRQMRSIVLLGEWFTSGEPWAQMRELVGLPATVGREQFLAALDAAAEASGYPCIIFIDALNVTDPRELWRAHLASMVEQVARYKWLKLLVSCRSTYLDTVVPKGLDIPKVEHPGFRGVEFDAFHAFFRFYQLEPASMPLMQPEFSNPLFLRLVCEAAGDAGLKQLPDEMLGITQVTEWLLASKNKRLAETLDYNPREQRVQKAVQVLVSEMARQGKPWVRWDRAKELVDEIGPSGEWSSSLFGNLVLAGVLIEDRVVPGPGHAGQDAVRFSFERLFDHLRARELLEGISQRSLPSAFAPGGQLNFIVSDRESARQNAGLLEALAIQVPERYGVELTEVADGDAIRDQAIQAVLDSLVWRASGSVGEQTEMLVREALGSRRTFARAMEALFALSARPANPLNALWFHEVARGIPMPGRDADLCPYLHLTYGTLKGLDRLLAWALERDLTGISEEVAELWATQLCWFCAASDRRVRDHATMAMVRLMEANPSVCARMIGRFTAVDDEYVIERCLAAAYGALIRAASDDALRETASVTYDGFFKRGTPTANAMIRDYARLVLEFALIRGVLPPRATPERFRPPYKSEWPLEWPDEAYVEHYKDTFRELPKLYRSCMHDDFATYTLWWALEGYEDVGIDEARRWVFKHVLDMGYGPEAVVRFDQYMVGKYGPGRAKPQWAERIGKKYQRIALWRLIGHVADHVPKRRSRWDPPPPSVPELQGYTRRDIDPTVLLKRTHTADTPAWWAPVQYDLPSVTAVSDDDWLDMKDFPPSASILAATRPAEGSQWFVLEADLEWSSRAEDAEIQEPYRLMWVAIRSYLVPRTAAEQCWNWLSPTNLRSHRLPEGFDLHRGFLGEYPWALPFRQFFEEASHEDLNENLPCLMLPTSHSVIGPDELDSYHEQTVSVRVPTPLFFPASGLRWDGVGGYVDGSGIPCFLYPPAQESGPPALVVAREYVEHFLAPNDFVLVWTVLGEKHVHGFNRHNLGYAEHRTAHVFMDGRLKSKRACTVRVRPPTTP